MSCYENRHGDYENFEEYLCKENEKQKDRVYFVTPRQRTRFDNFLFALVAIKCIEKVV